MSLFINNAKTLGANVGKYTLVVACRSGGVIVAGTPVKYDVATGATEHRTVVAETGTGYFVGIALEAAAAAGLDVRVAVEGWVDNVACAGVTSDGTLMPGNATLVPYTTSTTLPVVGILLEQSITGGTGNYAVLLNGYGKGLLGIL